jgi:DNA-directed RNA polymerase specialized sigma24 family protein
MIGSDLTAEGFEALLAWLDPDRDRAGERYQRIRVRLIALFVWRGCAAAEDLADETLNRVARRLYEGVEVRTQVGESYVYGVAQRVFQEALRRAQPADAEERELDRMLVTEAGEPGPRRRCFERCLAALSAADRRLLLRYHGLRHGGQARKILSDDLGITLNTLRIRIHRIRRKLQKSLEECLKGERQGGGGAR